MIISNPSISETESVKNTYSHTKKFNDLVYLMRVHGFDIDQKIKVNNSNKKKARQIWESI